MPTGIQTPLTKELAGRAIAPHVPNFHPDICKPIVHEEGDGLQYAICGGDQWVDGNQEGRKRRRVFFITADLRGYITDVQEVVKTLTPY